MRRTIEYVGAVETHDSRGTPTLAVTVVAGGQSGTVMVPSGASTGEHEAHELRDADGRGVQTALTRLEGLIAPALMGLDTADQRNIDRVLLELDGTTDKSHLGGNAMIGVSVACAKAAGGEDLVGHLRTLANIAPSRKEPFLFMNMVNGGKHAHSRLSFQEFQVVPQVETVDEALALVHTFQDALFEELHRVYGPIPSGDEGGLALDVLSVKEPLDHMAATAQKLGLEQTLAFGLDVAASSLYENGTYVVGGTTLSSEQLLSLHTEIVNAYPLVSIEDPFAEEDFSSFAALQHALPNLVVIGDDLTTTSVERLQHAIDQKSINAIIIKPNQVGTLTETLETMTLARMHNIDCIVSHRSGETEDNFIADLAVAFGCYGVKAGALGPRERMAKYTRLQTLLTPRV